MSASDNLTEGNKTYLREIYIKETTGRVKSIENKYFEKGIENEEDGITLYSLFTGKFFRKNKIRYNDDYISGEPDLIQSQEIDDIKCSWDIHTHFAKFEAPLDNMYYWQGQCYMRLLNKPISKFIYALTNTPPKLIEDEKRRLLYKLPTADDYEQACAELEKSMVYDDLDIKRRIIEVECPRNQTDIDRIPKRVQLCRDYLCELHERWNNRYLLTDLK
jgi:YqaJ-like viral recombinase domain.